MDGRDAGHIPRVRHRQRAFGGAARTQCTFTNALPSSEECHRMTRFRRAWETYWTGTTSGEGSARPVRAAARSTHRAIVSSFVANDNPMQRGGVSRQSFAPTAAPVRFPRMTVGRAPTGYWSPSRLLPRRWRSFSTVRVLGSSIGRRRPNGETAGPTVGGAFSSIPSTRGTYDQNRYHRGLSW